MKYIFRLGALILLFGSASIAGMGITLSSEPQEAALPAPQDGPAATALVVETISHPNEGRFPAPRWDVDLVNFEWAHKASDHLDIPAGFIRTQTIPVGFEAVPGAESYLLQLSAQENFQVVRHEFQLPHHRWVWSDPEVGQFYARVQAVRGSHVSAFSKVIPFRVMLSSPSLEPAQVELHGEQAPDVLLRWTAHEKAFLHEVQIADNPGFSNTKSFKSTADHDRWQATSPGVHYLRVRSVSASGWPLSRFSKIEKVSLEPWSVFSEVPAAKARHSTFWLGTGFRYLDFDQSSSDGGESARFSKMILPTLAVGLNLSLTDKDALDFQWSQGSAKIRVDSETALKNAEGQWQSMAVEYQRRFLHDIDWQGDFTVSLRRDEHPFLANDAGGGPVLLKNEFQSLGLGARMTSLFSGNREAGFALRYDYLLGSKALDGGELSSTPNVMLEGQAGITQHFKNQLRAGLIWVAQYQVNRYEFAREATQNTGTQSVLNSNVQLRFSYEFMGFSLVPLVPLRRRRDPKSSKKD